MGEVDRARATTAADRATVVLEVAAIIGPVVPHRLLRAVWARAGGDDTELEAALAEATVAGVLAGSVDGRGHRFVRPASAVTIVDGLPVAQRLRLHASVAEAIEDDPSLGVSWPAGIDHELVDRWAAADMPDRTVAPLRRIAGRAALAGDEEAVAAATGRLLEVLRPFDDAPWSEEAVDALVMHVRALRRLGRFERSAERARRAHRAGAGPRAAAEAATSARLFGAFDLERDVLGLGLDERGLDDRGDGRPAPGPAEVERIAARILALLMDEPAAAVGPARRLVAVTTGTAQEALARGRLGQAALMSGDVSTARTELTAALSSARSAAGADDRCRALVNMAWFEWEVGHPSAAAAYAEEVWVVAGRSGTSADHGRVAAGMLLRHHTARADWAAAERWLDHLRSLDEDRDGPQDDTVSWTTRLALRRGDVAAVRARLAPLVDEPASWEGYHLVPAIVEWAAVDGDAPVTDVLARCAVWLRRQPAIVTTEVAWAARTLARRARAPAAAAARLDDARAIPRLGPVGRPHRLLAEAEAAACAGRVEVGTWSAAADAARERGLVVEEVHARWQRAITVARTGVPPVDDLAAAHDVAVASGLGWYADAIRRTAVAAGVDVGPRPGASPRQRVVGATLDLTPREVDVLVLVADGLTNVDVADRLSIGRRTVGTHVSHILAKLGARTRGEAAAAARRAGLV